ncbi:MAG TPA: phosphotransferase [Acidisphaera sp.]|nr:phosphotransferase [Acidisphaera sp.]
MAAPVQVHASCVARDGEGVLLAGPPGSGKSDLALRLLNRGFVLVSDDRTDIEDGIARAPAAIAGLLEVRGLGVLRVPYAAEAALRLLVRLGEDAPRLPAPERDAQTGLPLVRIAAMTPSAADRVIAALDCACGRISQLAGAFADG